MVQAGRRVMAMISEARVLFDEWIAAVARAIDGGVSRYARRPQIVLSEEGGDLITARMKPSRKKPVLRDLSFRLFHGRPHPPLPVAWQAAFRGSRVEMLIRPGQVLLRPLDFPKQAEAFLHGMIRAQIDRLTPWSADEAVFGWSPPAITANERIELTLAATSKREMEPLIQMASDLGADSLALFAPVRTDDGAQVKIKLFDRPLQAAGGRRLDTARILRTALASTGFLAAASLLIALYVNANLDSELAQLMH